MVIPDALVSMPFRISLGGVDLAFAAIEVNEADDDEPFKLAKPPWEDEEVEPPLTPNPGCGGAPRFPEDPGCRRGLF